MREYLTQKRDNYETFQPSFCLTILVQEVNQDGSIQWYVRKKLRDWRKANRLRSIEEMKKETPENLWLKDLDALEAKLKKESQSK